MSRSGYRDDFDPSDNPACLLWPSIVRKAINGKRGQKFLKELRGFMDVMPSKRIIRNKLINAEGECCTIGVFCKAKNIDVNFDYHDPTEVGASVGIARSMAAEIEYMNDEWNPPGETPEKRWIRMRKWVDEKINQKGA